MVLSGCSRSGSSAAGPGNADLEQAIKARMAAEPELASAISVTADVDVVKKVVTLRGHVHSAAAKEEAERMARETEGVERVRNLLKVVVG